MMCCAVCVVCVCVVCIWLYACGLWAYVRVRVVCYVVCARSWRKEEAQYELGGGRGSPKQYLQQRESVCNVYVPQQVPQ